MPVKGIKQTCVLSIAVLMLLVSPAQAEESIESGAFHRSGLRLGVGAGMARMSATTSNQVKYKANIPTYMFNVGYAITPALEIGAMYVGSGKKNATTGACSVELKVPSSTSAYLRARWLGSGALGAYGLVSLGSVKHVVTNSLGNNIHSDRFIGLGLGAGISWKVTPNIVLDAGALMPNIPVYKKRSGLTTSAPGAMLSLNYAFGVSPTERAVYEPEPAVVQPEPVPAYEPPAKVVPTEQLWVIISFRSGRVAVSEESRKSLQGLAEKLQSTGGSQRLDVRGYADGEPIGGYTGERHVSVHDFQSQVALSAARAEAVANAFIEAGISRDRIHAEGYGATNFVADNDTKAGRDKNRRVEVYLITK